MTDEFDLRRPARVASDGARQWKAKDELSPAERAAVLVENARRGVAHLVAERNAEEAWRKEGQRGNWGR